MATTSPPQVVLVTGGTGLVGNALRSVVAADPSEEHAIWIFLGRKDCDLTDAVATKALFERLKPTHVIHLAARVGGLFANLTSNLQFYEDNMRINDSVLAACVTHRVKLVSCLSTCIFPDKSAYPIDETMVHNGPPHASNEGYSYAKRMLEVHSRLCRTAFGLDFVTVIPTNVYGPYDQFNLSQSHVVPGLIHKCYLAKLHSTPLIVGGTGKPLRQFMCVARVLAHSHTSHSLFNHAASRTTSRGYSCGHCTTTAPPSHSS
jgi:GDP-L-fucose synthase